MKFTALSRSSSLVRLTRRSVHCHAAQHRFTQRRRCIIIAAPPVAPDQIPLDALLRLCAFLDRWDLLDYALRQYRRRSLAVDSIVTMHTPLDEAIDVQSGAAVLLKTVRDLGQGGFDDHEQGVIERLCLDLHTEADQVLAAIRARRLDREVRV